MIEFVGGPYDGATYDIGRVDAIEIFNCSWPPAFKQPTYIKMKPAEHVLPKTVRMDPDEPHRAVLFGDHGRAIYVLRADQPDDGTPPKWDHMPAILA